MSGLTSVITEPRRKVLDFPVLRYKVRIVSNPAILATAPIDVYAIYVSKVLPDYAMPDAIGVIIRFSDLSVIARSP